LGKKKKITQLNDVKNGERRRRKKKKSGFCRLK